MEGKQRKKERDWDPRPKAAENQVSLESRPLERARMRVRVRENRKVCYYSA